MEIINGERRSGRTVALIYISATSGQPILTPTVQQAALVEAEARKLGVKIPRVQSFSQAVAWAKKGFKDIMIAEGLYLPREAINKRGGYLIDNADALFEQLLEEKLGAKVAAITICQPVAMKERYWEKLDEATKAGEGAREYMKPEPDTAADDEWKEDALAMMRELDEKISRLRVVKVSTDAGPWEIKGPFGIGKKNPYAEAAAIVTAWCEKNFYDSFLVTLELDGKPETRLLQYDFEKDAANVPCWDVDWWEGQTKIKVLGFRPFCEFLLYGEPSEE